MTDDDIQARIMHLIETNVDEENRKLALEWVAARAVAFDAMKGRGLDRGRHLVNVGLRAK